MAESIDNVPDFKMPDPDELARIRADLGVDKVLSEEPIQEDRPRHRRRGRPRKYARDEFGRVLKDQPLDPNSTSEEPLSVLPSPPLTGRDTKEVAKRLSGILIGATSVGAVMNPAIQMTQSEADNIATPLTAYLARTEATSRIARQVLDEYDIAAFVIASLAYIVRVVKDIQNERQSARNQAIAAGRSPSGIQQRVGTSQRAIESEIEQIVPDSNAENEDGQERPVNSDWASIAPIHRDVTEV